jgi:hypothetical protein
MKNCRRWEWADLPHVEHSVPKLTRSLYGPRTFVYYLSYIPTTWDVPSHKLYNTSSKVHGGKMDRSQWELRLFVTLSKRSVKAKNKKVLIFN